MDAGEDSLLDIYEVGLFHTLKPKTMTLNYFFAISLFDDIGYNRFIEKFKCINVYYNIIQNVYNLYIRTKSANFEIKP